MAAAAAVVLIAALVLVPAVSASALTQTTIAFVTKGPITSAYGGNWSAQLITRMSIGGSVPTPVNQATVDVFVTGVAKPFLTGLPIQADGSVYVTPPVGDPLVPGTYKLTAVLKPVLGGYLQTSQTAQPLELDISAFTLTANVGMDKQSVDAGKPVAELGLSGEYLDKVGTVPPGTWHLVVKSGSQSILDEKLAQKAGKDSTLRVPLGVKLQPGHDYRVDAKFTPVSSLAKGLDVTQADVTTFRTPDDSLGGMLARDVPYPLWLAILTGLVPLALLVAVVVLTVRLRRRGTQLETPAIPD